MSAVIRLPVRAPEPKPPARPPAPPKRISTRSIAFGLVIFLVAYAWGLWVGGETSAERWEVKRIDGQEFACRDHSLSHGCFPCRTTDFVDARRVCDAAGIRKGGGK